MFLRGRAVLCRAVLPLQCRPALFLAGYVVSVGSLVVFACLGVWLGLARVVAKRKSTPADADAEAGTTDNKDEQRLTQGAASDAAAAVDSDNVSRTHQQGSQAVPWVLFGLLAAGAICCAVAVGLDTTRG